MTAMFKFTRTRFRLMETEELLIIGAACRIVMMLRKAEHHVVIRVFSFNTSSSKLRIYFFEIFFFRAGAFILVPTLPTIFNS